MEESETNTQYLIVPRNARFHSRGSWDGELDEIWIVCHGYGQLASAFLESLRPLERAGRLLVAPEALSRFYLDGHVAVGASWMTREDRSKEMEDYIRYLDLLYDRIFEIRERSSVKLKGLGFSQGVATIARWALGGKTRLDHLILWGGMLPPEIDELKGSEELEPLRQARLTRVAGTRDRFLPEEAWLEEAERLKALELDFEEIRFDGGHRLDDDSLRRLDAG